MFDVYVDGATETSREAVRELASAMAARYRLPAVELETRLTRGRFRVKAGVDRATAETYLRDLAAIGARVRIEPAGEPPADAPGRSPQPEPRPARSSLPSQAESGGARSSLPSRPESRPSRSPLPPQPESGATRSSSPPEPESRPARSPLSSQREPGGMRSSVPSRPESRPVRSALPPEPESRPARSSLPSQPESGGTRSALPPQPESRPVRSALPPQPESRPARSALPPQLEPGSTSSQSPYAEDASLMLALPPQLEPGATSSQSPYAEDASLMLSLLPQPESRSTQSSQSPHTEDLSLTLLPQAGWPPAGSSGSPAHGGAAAATGPITTLGALDRSGALSLATLDDELTPVPPTDGTLPASMGPAAPRPARPARSRNEPVDPFAPPELAAAEPLRVLADEDVAHRARKLASTPPPLSPGGTVAATPSRVRGADPALRAPPGPPAGMPQSPAPASPGSPAGAPQSPAPVPSAPRTPRDLRRILDALPSALGIAARRLGSELMARLPVLASARVRLVVGVALGIALGFVPAHLVAGMRERSAFAAIDARVAAVQSTADTPDRYAALDAFRAEQLDAKYSARRSVAVTSLLVWAVVGAALACGWFSLFRSPPAAPRPVQASPGGLRDPLGG